MAEVAGGRTPRIDRRAPGLAACLFVVLAAVLLLRLAYQEQGGPPHLDLSLGYGIPATLFVPGEQHLEQFPYAPPDDKRLPLIVVAHGYSADRRSMGTLSRSLAKAGYAVLSFDFRGHGDNTKPFEGDLREDFREVLDWAAQSPYIDSSRIAVLGHSMGAGAALDFATVDPRPVAVIPISGGNVVNDVRVPPNVLLLAASGDPDRIKTRQASVAADLQGRTNLHTETIDGTDHIRILMADDTVTAITDFLDPVLHPDPSGPRPAKVDDPRLGTALAYLLVVVALTGLTGTFVGRLSPTAVDPRPVRAGGFALIAGSLVVTMPLLATESFNIFPLGAGQPVIMHLVLAGAVLWGTRLYARRSDGENVLARWIGEDEWLPDRGTVALGLAAVLVVLVLLAPLSVVSHRLMPTTARLVYLAVFALLALVFFLPFEALIRRGRTWPALGLGVLGRALLVVTLFVGVGLHALPPVILIVAPLFILQYVLLEVFSGACYAASRNVALIAVVDSVFIAWVVTTLTPIS